MWMRNNVATLNDNWLIFVKVQGRTQDQLQNQGDEKTVSSILEQTKCALQVSKYLCFFWCLMLQILGHRVLMFNATIYIYMLSYHTSERTCSFLSPLRTLLQVHLHFGLLQGRLNLMSPCKRGAAGKTGDDAWRLTAMMAATRNAPQSQWCYCVCFHCLGVWVYDKPKMTWPEPHGFSGERLKSHI